MAVSIQFLIAGHREIEAALDVLADGIASGRTDMDAVRRVRMLCSGHYAREEAFLVRLAESDDALAAKLRGQHDEALEIAARLEEAVAGGETRDVMYLTRRLLAIVQHNMIEEERDVFPCLGKLAE